MTLTDKPSKRRRRPRPHCPQRPKASRSVFRPGGSARLEPPWRTLLPASAFGFWLLASLPAAQHSQAATAPPAPAIFEEQVAVTWVLVPVTVRSSRGYVTDLEKGDFRLSIEGRSIGIESFDPHSGDPVSLLILQDLSGSIGNQRKLETSRHAVRRLLASAGPGAEFALATFAGGRMQVESPFTTDRQEVSRLLGGWRPYGTTALHDAVAWAPDLTAEGMHSKRAVILLTDGSDNSSTLEPETVRELIAQSDQPVYIFDLGADPGSEAGATEMLRRLADSSGGRYFPVPEPKAGAGAVAEVEEQLQHQYLLGFRTSAGSAAEVRRIDVEVPKRKRLSVTFRRSYQGGPPAVLQP